jgi:hypothetical protein
MNVLGLEEFNVLEGYDSEQWYKFVVEAKEEPFFCTLCGSSAGIGENGEALPNRFPSVFPIKVEYPNIINCLISEITTK